MEFNTSHSCNKHLPRLIYWHVLWSSSIFFRLCRASLVHIMFKCIHSLINRETVKRKRQANLSFCFDDSFLSSKYELKMSKKNYRPVCILAFWWSHHRMKRKKKNGKRRSSVREGELDHFTFISIHCNRDQQKNMMIDSRYRWQNTNAHQSSDPMIIAIRLCIHTRFSHTTRKCRAVNSIDYAYNFLFTHYMELESTWLWSVIHANRYLHGHYQKKTDCVCLSAFEHFVLFYFFSWKKRKTKGVNQYNRMRKSRVYVRRGWTLPLFCLSLVAIIQCWNTQMSIGMCMCEYWSEK